MSPVTETPEPQAPATGGEPLSPPAVITAAVSAILALLAAFGLDLTAEQTAAILGAVAVFGPLVVWLLGRRKTVPLQNVAAARDTTGTVVAFPAAPLPNGLPVAVRASGVDKAAA